MTDNRLALIGGGGVSEGPSTKNNHQKDDDGQLPGADWRWGSVGRTMTDNCPALIDGGESVGRECRKDDDGQLPGAD